MKIGIASDHGGYNLKKELIFKLKDMGHEMLDCGTYDEERTDYPIYAFKVCEKVVSKDIEFGIAICKTGIGMSIACNKVDGILAAKIDNKADARLAKEHNGANVITFSANKTLSEALEMIEEYMKSEMLMERHELRRKMIRDYENEH
jgi:ribose 5-phosphate isomerase B